LGGLFYYRLENYILLKYNKTTFKTKHTKDINMRYHYRGERKPGTRLISLSGIYAFSINHVQQVIVDPKQDNLVVNLDQKLLLVIEDHPDFELILSEREKQKQAPKPVSKAVAKKDTVTESKQTKTAPIEKSEEPIEAPKPRKKRGRKAKVAKVENPKVEVQEAKEETTKED
jgi:outer membrane biosynthesis protein TonB